ncbi:hypothetical protein BGZ51_000770 [Haplosporangium sp. Z 767]|nr:hypothetical protein BGZ50_004092 [Haplosporangium sp. Z 11]KAF9194189.1 hypothetical protein BGZ51_000770 [Haplosporangium sp. Z 767]
MTLPDSLKSPSPSTSSGSPLFSLPRIPYFFTITPYPLTCQSAQQQSLLPRQRMKRRYYMGVNDRECNASDDSSHSLVPEDRIESQNQHQQSVPFNQQEDRNPGDATETGMDGIEGRVIKKMRRIKLDSESPPSDTLSSFSSEQDGFDTNTQPWQHSQRNSLPQTVEEPSTQHARIEPFKGFRPIKISTKRAPAQSVSPESTSTAGPEIGGSYVQPQEQVKHATYSGMNHLLHQVHAARFGIPEDIASEDVTSLRLSEPQQNWHQQYDHQHPYQQEHQEQQKALVASSPWHPIHKYMSTNTQAMDEDDEMTDVNTTMDGSTSYLPSENQSVPQDIQQRHQQHQHQSSETERERESNVYQDINAQLRAAFLTRAEMSNRYR